jgi:hypothetical protein
MNHLSVYVDKNTIDVSIYFNKRITVRYNLTDGDLDLILSKYKLSWASIVLDATVVDCEFIPVDKFSFYDKFLLKKRLKQKNTTVDTLFIGSKYIKHNDSKKLALTTCNLSATSQHILKQIIQYKIPLRNVDVVQNLVAKNAINSAHVTTKWCGVVYKNNEHITLAVYLNTHLVTVRDLKDTSEILQTFQYLSRSVYMDDDAITILQEKDLGLALRESIPSKLNCERFDSFVANKNCPKYIYHPKTSFLHNMYLLPKCAGLASVSFSGFAILTSLYNCYVFYDEKRSQRHTGNEMRCMSQEEISSLEHKSNQKKMLLTLSEYKASQSWSQQYSLDVLFSVFEVVHKGQFLNKMHCEIHGNNLVIMIDLSPFAVYKNNNKGKIINILQKYRKEALTVIKNVLAENFDKTFSTKVDINSKNICLKISLNEINKSNLKCMFGNAYERQTYGNFNVCCTQYTKK